MGLCMGWRSGAEFLCDKKVSVRHVRDPQKFIFQSREDNDGYIHPEVETFGYKDGQELSALFSHFSSRHNCICQCKRPLYHAHTVIENSSKSADARRSPCIRINQSMECQNISPP